MSTPPIADLSRTLDQARKTVTEVEPLTKNHGDFSLDVAYQIQAMGVQTRLNDGEKIVGYKMGLTSKAKMDQMGLKTPIYGVLTDTMQVSDAATFSLTRKIHPKAEPEIYFRTSRELSGSVTPEEAMTACSDIGIALEILDSRYTGFKYFTLPDVVADNASSAYFVLGRSIKTPTALSLKDLTIEIREDDKAVFTATGAAIMGDPILSLCELVKLFAEHGKTLPAGSIVLAGAATQAIELKSGKKISGHLSEVGEARFTVTD